MSETEQADETLRVALPMPAVAATIAEDAREKLDGVEVVSVGPLTSIGRHALSRI